MITDAEKQILLSAAFILHREAGLIDHEGHPAPDANARSWAVPRVSAASFECTELALNPEWRPR